jgi:hypothetical protein
MVRQQPVMVASEHRQTPPLLIIDKQGTLGPDLARKLHEQFLVVCVSGQTLGVTQTIIHVPYQRKIPLIPDNTYSHIFVFYHGEREVIDMLPALMKKAHATNAHLLFITSLPFWTPQLSRHLSQHLFHSMRLLVYGEVFSEGFSEPTAINTLIRQAGKYGKIAIPNNGIGMLYPVFAGDVVEAIIGTTFAKDTKHRTTLVYPRHAISELSVARMLKKHNPLLQLDFVKQSEKSPEYHLPEGAYYFSPYPLEERLTKLLRGTVVEQEVHKPKKKVKFPIRKFRFRPGFLLITLFALLLPILLTAFFAVSGVGALQVSIRQLERGQIGQAEALASFATATLSIAQGIGSNVFYVDPFVRQQKVTVLTQIGIARELAQTEVDLLYAYRLAEKLVKEESEDPKADFQEIQVILKSSLLTLQKMRVDGVLPPAVTGKIASLEPILLPLENTIDVLPQVLGFEGKRTYLVLLQNNMELRPGGGFIGSYGILELERGRVLSFKVSDVYDADGKLTKVIEPPFGLRRYLGASHWFLRDSNFSVDFPQNAILATNFLQLETGQIVDGVIAVDTTFLQYILAGIGPVTIPDYKETVTAENFYIRTQTHAEKNFFPGSTQKKDFLRALLVAMQEKVGKGAGVNYKALGAQVGKAIAGKHVLFVVSDEATQKILTVNNLSSSLFDPRRAGENGFLDFFGVVDANVGMNKTNYYLKREIQQQTNIGELGSIQTTSTVTYTNTSKSTSPFGGDYRNYVRFVLPAHTVLRGITVDGKSQPTTDAITDPNLFTSKTFVPPAELELETTIEQGKQVIGFFMIVPQGATKKIDVTYDHVRVIDPTQASFVYNLRLFKQPGTQNDPYSLTLVYPATFQPVRKQGQLSDVGGKLVYSETLSQDKDLSVIFSKK